MERGLGKIKKNNKGVTLLEMIVAIFLFTVIMLAVTEIFQLVIEGQRNSLAAQDIQENMRYALEVMSKEMRMAERSDGDCPSNPPPSATNRIFNINAQNNVLYFKNKDGECVSYFLGVCPAQSGLPAYNGLNIKRGANRACLTSHNLQVNSLNFNVVDNPIAGPLNEQPKATVSLDLEIVSKAIHKQNVKIQTTISSRYYE